MKRTLIALAALLTSAALSHGGAPVALFDQAHGQRFTIEKTGELNLGGLAQLFRDAGFEVRSTDATLTAQNLAGVKALISSGGFVPFSKEEAAAVRTFVEGGGSAVILMHIAPTYQDLALKFGVNATSGVLRETRNVIEINSLDFDVKDLTPGTLFNGLDSFTVRGAWGVVPVGEGAVSLARTSEGAWIDLNRNNVRDEAREPQVAFGVVALTGAGKGRFLASATTRSSRTGSSSATI